LPWSNLFLLAFPLAYSLLTACWLPASVLLVHCFMDAESLLACCWLLADFMLKNTKNQQGPSNEPARNQQRRGLF